MARPKPSAGEWVCVTVFTCEHYLGENEVHGLIKVPCMQCLNDRTALKSSSDESYFDFVVMLQNQLCE
jgi:hypothetical protein